MTGFLLLLLLALGGLLLTQPRWLSVWMGRRWPGVTFHVQTPAPVVALTIDDGPDPEGTPAVLEALARHGARATFFLVSDRVAGNGDLVRRILGEGHEIANHLTQVRPSICLSAADFERQLLEAHAALSAFGEVRWFRPGSGWFNRRMLAQVARHGYRCALGSVHPYDAQLPFTPWMAWRVARGASPGAVIILHDGPRMGGRTAAALERALPRLRARGLRVETLSVLVEAATGVDGGR